MDLTILSDKELEDLFNDIKIEMNRREEIEQTNDIIAEVEEKSFVIGHNVDQIEGFIKHSLALPLKLKLQVRTNHPNDYDDQAVICCINVSRLFEPHLPTIFDFQRTGPWDTVGFESEYYADGIGHVNLWFRPFSSKKKRGLGIDLSKVSGGKTLNAFFERDEKYIYFTFESEEYKLDELKEKYSDVPKILKSQYNDQETIEINGNVWEFAGSFRVEEHLDFLEQILPIR